MTKPPRFWFLNAYEQEIILPKGEYLHLSSSRKIRRFERFSLLKDNHQNNTAIYFLKSGTLKISILANKEETIKHLVHEGQFFGEMALAEVEDVTLFAIALEDTTLSYFDIQTARQIMQNYPEFRKYMMELISRRVRVLEQRLEELATQDSRSRVISFLQDLAQNFGKSQEGKKVVPNFLKNREIAQLTFTSRQTVNAVMNELKRKQVIEFDQKSITFSTLLL